MANSLDTADVRSEQGAELGARGCEDDSCGESLDWLGGVAALPRSETRPAEISESVLTKVIEREIIPRLFLAHRNPHKTPDTGGDGLGKLVRIDSDSFARLFLSDEPNEILDRVQGLIDGGMSLKEIYLDLLAPVARRLGELWDEDRCTFTDVTLGLSRLHQVLREVGRQNGEGFRRAITKRRAYFVPAPGEQHTFGLSIVEEFFLQAGWETACDHTVTAQSVLQTVSQQRLDILGFSVGSEEFLEPLAALVAEVRKVSLNPGIEIFIGGNFVLRHPELAQRVGRVTVVSDAINAVHVAEQLVPYSSGYVQISKPSDGLRAIAREGSDAISNPVQAAGRDAR